jgi:pyruvate formate lyase activating enzyme
MIWIMNGMIFDIQRFSTHDGAGIRTIVFLKGCPLRCAWCENPESQETGPELLFDPKHCIDCASCLRPEADAYMHRNESGSISAVHRGLGIRTESAGPAALAELCPSRAIRVAGRLVSAEEIIAEVMKDEAFFRKSGGGVTFSGGEPLMQPVLLRELLGAFAERGVDCAVESCLAIGRGILESILPFRPTWLVDLKHTDAGIFCEGTGGDLAEVMANFTLLAESGARIVFRVPVIPGFNDDDASMHGIMEFAASLPRPSGGKPRMDLLPYHDLAAGKYAALGRPYPYPRSLAVTQSWLRRQAEAGRALGMEIAIGG